LLGASASVFGVLVAAALMAPHVEVFYCIFFPVTVAMLAVGGLLVAAYAVLATAPSAGPELAHLGGALLGFLLMRNQHWLTPFAPRLRIAPTSRPARRRTVKKDWSKDMNR